MKKLLTMIAATISIIILCAIGFIILENTILINSKEYTIYSDKIPEEFDGFKIVQISDLQSETIWGDNTSIIEKIKSQNPDIVVITGDLINSTDTNFDTAINLAKEISSSYKTYYIDGNHEQILHYYNEELYNEFITRLKETGVIFLENESIEITKNFASIKLIGLNVPLRYYSSKEVLNESGDHYDLETLYKAVREETFNEDDFDILLAHNPFYFDIYKETNANLILTGHTHGGVINIPFMGGLFSPEGDFFPEYYKGLYIEEDTAMIVNPGLSKNPIGIRIFNPREISIITLKHEKE